MAMTYGEASAFISNNPILSVDQLVDLVNNLSGDLYNKTADANGIYPFAGSGH